MGSCLGDEQSLPAECLLSYLCRVTGLNLIVSAPLYRDVPQSNVSPLLPRRLLPREEPLGLPQSGACSPAASLVAWCGVRGTKSYSGAISR